MAFFAFIGHPRSHDRVALLEVDRQLEQGKAAYRIARHNLANATAARRRDAARGEALRARLADLEQRAVAALRGDREDLARDAAEKIATIEETLAAIGESLREQDLAITQLRRTVEEQHKTIGEIERGRRLGEVRAAILESRASAGYAAAGLAGAREALETLRHRQSAEDVLHDALDDPGANLIADMADAGFGASPRAAADAVFARLRTQAAVLLPPAKTQSNA